MRFATPFSIKAPELCEFVIGGRLSTVSGAPEAAGVQLCELVPCGTTGPRSVAFGMDDADVPSLGKFLQSPGTRLRGCVRLVGRPLQC